MLDNDYGDHIDDWKVDLIKERARWLGIRDHDLADAQQTIVRELSEFRFDEAKSNGATEKTAVIAVIDLQLRKILRTQRRYRQHVTDTMTDLGLDQYALVDPRSEDRQQATELAFDVREAIADLSSRDQQICIALGEGCSILETAKRLSCEWHTVKRRIECIREHLKSIGLDGWLIDE